MPKSVYLVLHVLFFGNLLGKTFLKNARCPALRPDPVQRAKVAYHPCIIPLNGKYYTINPA